MIRIKHPHEDNRDPDVMCVVELEFETEMDSPGGMEGQDADGNRGMYYGPSFTITDALPAKCPICGHEFDENEMQDMDYEIGVALEKYAADWTPPDPYEYED